MESRAQLMKKIDEASFAVNDITLYLDTHPTDTEALKFFEAAAAERKQLLEQYEAQYEPLQIDCVNPAVNNQTQTETKYAGTAHWTWADGPVPWEGGHC